MKKMIFLMMLVALGNATFAQRTYTIIGHNEHEYFVDEEMPDGFKSCKFYFYNNSSNDVVIKYEKVTLDYPSGWMVSFCDNRDCLPDFPMSGTYAALKPNDTTNLKLDVFPITGADTALVQYAIWDEAKPNDRDTLTFKIYARWGLNIAQLGNTLSQIYPNPLTDKLLNINGNMISLVEICGIDGKVLVSQKYNGENETQVDLQPLKIGTYFVKIHHVKGIDTHTLMITR